MDNQKLKEYSEKLLQSHRDISGFYNEYAKSVGLTFASLEVLSIIWRENGCFQSTIIQQTLLPKQTVNAIIKTFKNNGIIKPPFESDSDKRNKVIEFSEKGREYAGQIISKVKETEYNALSALGEDNCDELVRIIALYKDNLKIRKE